MVERRNYIRFHSEAKIILSTIDFAANIKTDAYLLDCSKIGAKIVSPIYFEAGQNVEVKMEALGDPLCFTGKVVECKEDPKQTFRFERTFVVHVQFETLSDDKWNDLLSISKKL